MTNFNKVIQVPIYEPEVGEAYRIGINYLDSFVPLFWVKMGGDGSVYVGSSQKEKGFLAVGSAPVLGGKVDIKYADAVPVKNPEQLRNPSKISFHSSEIINTMDGEGERHEKIPHRELEGQMLLSMFLFRHPSKMTRRLQNLEDTDVLIDYPFDEAKPLCAYVYVEGLKDLLQPVEVETATDQINLIFNYRDLADCNDLRLQIILAHGPEGPWPPHSYKLFPVLREES